jgi:hypothetical protein
MLFSCIRVPGKIGSLLEASNISTTLAWPFASKILIISPVFVPTIATILSPTIVPVIDVARVSDPRLMPISCTIGDGPDILSAASQKLKILPLEPAEGHFPSSTGPDIYGRFR